LDAEEYEKDEGSDEDSDEGSDDGEGGESEMDEEEGEEELDEIDEEAIFKLKDATVDEENFTIGKNLEGGKSTKFDLTKVKDLYDDQEILHEIEEQDTMIYDDPKKSDKENEKEGKKKMRKLSQKKLEQVQDEEFKKEYLRVGGIQHIICSATLTIDKKGRITPRSAKIERRKQLKVKSGQKKRDDNPKDEIQSTLDQMCEILRFRSK